MMRAGALCLALFLAPLAVPAAAPLEWAVRVEGSAIAFDYRLNGKDQSGQFTRFSGTGQFDPARPEEAILDLWIESDSIDLGEPLFSAFATSAEWFDAKTHPQVRYRLSHLVPLGNGRFTATGQISLRGHTMPLTSEIYLDLTADAARAEGSLVLDRTDFGLGVGPSALIVTVDAAVTVRFALIAFPAGTQKEQGQ